MFLAETSIQLVPDGTLLLHLVVVVVMVAVLNRTLLKPILKILADREAQIQGRLSEAQALDAQRLEKENQYQSSLRSARSEGYQLLERERADALKAKEEKVRTIKQDLHQRVAAEVASIHRQEEQVKSELEVQASAISETIAERVLNTR